MESKIEKYLNNPPAVCYPIGDRVVFCLDELDAIVEYQLHKQLLKCVEGIIFDNRILKLQTKMGSYTFVSYQRQDWDIDIFKEYQGYQLSPRVTKNASIEGLLKMRRIGDRLIKYNPDKEVLDEEGGDELEYYTSY